MATPNMKLARWLPSGPPAVGDGVVVSTAGATLATQFAIPGAAGPTLPVATQEGDVVVAGVGPTFNWQAGAVDGTRY